MEMGQCPVWGCQIVKDRTAKDIRLDWMTLVGLRDSENTTPDMIQLIKDFNEIVALKFTVLITNMFVSIKLKISIKHSMNLLKCYMGMSFIVYLW